MIILVDIDGVIADWSAEYDRQLDIVDPENEIPRTAKQATFDLFTGRSERHQSMVLAAMNTPGMYRNLAPIKGAREALEEMVAIGHIVYLVSSPFPSNYSCASDKFAWVIEHYGEDWAKRLILTQDKTAVVGDILIDDKPEITGRVKPVWEHVVFDALWNRHVKGKQRITNWEEWKGAVGYGRLT